MTREELARDAGTSVGVVELSRAATARLRSST